MFQMRRLRMAWALAALALMPAAALADDPSNAKGAKKAPEPAAADGDLLEYLGSVDSEGQEWMEYLAQTDIAPATKPKKAPVATEDDPK